jgi:hypothetical protein
MTGQLPMQCELPRSRVAKAAAMIAVALFCFQLSRFYIVIPGCWHGTSDGLSLQHCKDVPDGFGIKSVQLDLAPAANLFIEFRAAWHAPVHVNNLLSDALLPTPFHPPKLG